MATTTSRDPALLLISPGIIKWTDMDFGLPHLVSIGGYVQQELDLRVEILDLNYEGGDHRRLQNTLEELGPFLAIGLSCYSSFDYMRVMTLARFLKTLYPDVPLITGGYHASALVDDVIFEGSPFDCVIPGEGEVPMAKICETLLGGGQIEETIWDKGVVADLDTLPYYQWQLLDRYWPRAQDIGRKFQIYLSRGCPYRCTFCMERAKSGYSWRAYSSDRAVEELKRLAARTDLSHWVVNLADPLFGFNRKWRREVLAGILEHQLLPRQYWTLTRSDDLHEEDIELLAKAHFSIGIGMESGSPTMLKLMQKARKPEKYLQAQLRLAKLSRKFGLNWAGNIIVGHPGETMETMRETHEFAVELFTSAKETCGWLSIDPFRLYPGSQVHEQMAHYEQEYGSQFFHKQWWKSWYDAPFRAEHLDASSEVDFPTRVRFMYEHYGPLVEQIVQRFRGQGRSVDRVFQRSLEEQSRLMSGSMKDDLVRRAQWTRERLERPGASNQPAEGQLLQVPLGLHVRDPNVRRREQAVRRMLERGILRTERLIEVLLTTPAEDYMSEEEAEAMLYDRLPEAGAEGEVPPFLGISLMAIAFEALNPNLSDRVADMLAVRGYVAALFSRLVGPKGRVLLQTPLNRWDARALRRSIKDLGNVELHYGPPTTVEGLQGPLDGIWFGGALPRIPVDLIDLLHDPEGRFVGFLGPRFRPQDLICASRHGEDFKERLLARAQVPIVAGEFGWLGQPRRIAAAQ